ncbi:MAG: hypothetical protein A2908_00340 [Candidatus Staskawiczbacteria bacterium RIFCSPLOWO2_01_FULL_38_12b]|uniref:Response regulatory domain-containing protein n=1 Tax=Candidatus Staskawiczbacteria bacterium RIFCSPLOWO2_01_FULL_38_12b TaxID=1802214 RepID=A0A1G2IDK5_9BACT|nr:MAG: hypothetical protein A2908_00340 [Candidatus Staskawiczbacteria bacterium RIFCSPLOWO2_01_FULL_38_12b]
MKNHKKILIIDDDENIRNVLIQSLVAKKCNVLQARNGQEGLEMALKEHPDLILLDMLMPIMDGMTTLKNIRKDPWGENVPVIILTNLNATNENTVEDMVSNKPLHYLIKSNWKISEVVKKIEETLNTK